MPTPRRYANQAERQAAYRRRQAEARNPPSGPISPRALAPRPGPTRWAALIRQTASLLGVVQEEMEAYFEQRAEAWQASDRGEAFQERLEAVQEAQAAVKELIGPG